MESSVDKISRQYDHPLGGLRRSDLHADPIRQFGDWFETAVAAGIRDVNAMSLATASSEGKPLVRVVLLKGFDGEGFVFFTNYQSDKGRQLQANPHAALAFYWIEMDRQIRVTGAVEKTSRQESERYFHSRPLASQLGAWASRQSEVIASRDVLEKDLAQTSERFAGQEVPLPPHWGGFRVRHETIEFWQGRPNRLHDRFRYRKETKGDEWVIERLSP